MKKGILFTLDATLAIILALSIILSSLFYLSQSYVSFEDQNLYKISIDSLAVLEKQNVLDNFVITNSSTEIQSFLELLPVNTCAKIDIYDDVNTKLITIRKYACTYSQSYIVSRRVFISEEKTYLAKIEAWYQ